MKSILYRHIFSTFNSSLAFNSNFILGYFLFLYNQFGQFCFFKLKLTSNKSSSKTPLTKSIVDCPKPKPWTTYHVLFFINSSQYFGIGANKMMMGEPDSRRASSRGIIPRAKIKTVKMTFVIVFGMNFFILMFCATNIYRETLENSKLSVLTWRKSNILVIDADNQLS